MVSFSSVDPMVFDRGGAARRLRLPLTVAAVALAVFAAYLMKEWHRHSSARSTAVRLRQVAAYQRQYVPGGESLANQEIAKRALEEIARVLERDPSNRPAMMAAGEINAGRSDAEQARDWYGRLAVIDSSNAAAFAGMSAASLTRALGAVLDAESRAGLRPAQWIADQDLRRSLAERWSAEIAKGIDAGSKAVTIDQENEGAMLTLDAWHRLAADLAASPEESRQHITSADEWRRKALDARRLKAERRSQ